MNRLACLVASILLSTVPPTFAAVQYTVTDLGTLGGQYSYALAINAAGQIVGNSDAGPDVGERAFLYSDGVMKDLGTLGGISEAFGINGVGSVVGDSAALPNGDIHAFFTMDSGMTDITPTGSIAYARGINSSGQIVGETELNTELYSKPFIYSNGTLTLLEPLGQPYGVACAINGAGQIVGSAGIPGGEHAFLYQNGVSTDLGGTSARSIAYAINESGSIVGLAQSEGFQHAFLYENGRMQDLGALPPDIHMSNYSLAYGINDNGVIVGVSNMHAVIWVNGTISDLNQMIPLDFAIYLTEARGINDSGEIICNGVINGNWHAFLLTPGVTPPALSVEGSLRRVSSHRHVTIRGIATNRHVKSVTFHVGRVRPGHGTASHSGGATGKHLEYATGTDSWSLSTVLKPGKNYITVIAHGSYGDSEPVTVEVIQK